MVSERLASTPTWRRCDRLEPLVEQAEHVVPGHGGPIDGARALAILREDRAYLEALRRTRRCRWRGAPAPARDPRDEPHAAMSCGSAVGRLVDLDVAQAVRSDGDHVAVAELGAVDAARR